MRTPGGKALIAASMLWCAAAPPPAGAETWQKSFALSGPADVRVVTDHARVRLDPWKRRAVDVRVATTGWSIGPGGLRVSAADEGGRIRIEVLLPPWGFAPDWTHRSIEIVVRLPDSADVDIETEDSDVQIPPMRGRFRVRTWDGLITVQGLAGRIEMRSGDGPIRARGLAGSLAAEAGDGDLEVEGRFDRLDLETRNGALIARVAPGSVPAADWKLETTDGEIVLQTPRDLGAVLDVATERGRIELAREGVRPSRSKRTRLRETLGAGGPALRLRSRRGTIMLDLR
ncbi:MAG: hypothetical protein A2W00_03035 [Candidatus Eisenbacteria bacterium RBG_16_71_46]|nr:MAG: hypothetical protein A2W00_03035 [Candidatus Eisenbacteria bacterium RBG_16_71_46]